VLYLRFATIEPPIGGSPMTSNAPKGTARCVTIRSTPTAIPKATT